MGKCYDCGTTIEGNGLLCHACEMEDAQDRADAKVTHLVETLGMGVGAADYCISNGLF